MESKIGRRFDQRAREYDNSLTAWIGELELRQIRPWVPPGTRVLDYGCGTGRTTIDLLRRGCAVTAYDISQEMMQQAQTKISQLGREVEFVYDPSLLENRKWPLVTCIGVMDYYPNPINLLSTLGRLLEPGGRLIITYPNALSPLAWIYILSSRLTVPASARTPASAVQIAEKTGFQVESLSYAFPSIRPVGHTIVLVLRQQD